MVTQDDITTLNSTVQGITVTHKTREHCTVTELEPKSKFLVPQSATENPDGTRMSLTDIQQLKWHENTPKHVTQWNDEFTVETDTDSTYDAITQDALTTYGNVVATFYPEPVIGDRPRKTDRTWTITAPINRAMVNNTKLAERDSYESDAIADFPYAPDIVKNWGSYTRWPFSVEIDHIKIAGKTLTIEETTQLLKE